MIETVLKLGGSLEATGSLERLLPMLERLAAEGRRLLVVPGGGRFADAVRAACEERDPGPDAAHWAAVLAMDQYAHLLAGWAPGATLVTDAAAADEVAEHGRLPILAPYAWLRESDSLPHSWDVTGDSIAARIAAEIEAPRLVLVKAAGALPACVAPPPFAIPADDLAHRGVVDPHFPRALGFDRECWLVDGREPGRLLRLLHGDPGGAIRVTARVPG